VRVSEILAQKKTLANSILNATLMEDSQGLND